MPEVVTCQELLEMEQPTLAVEAVVKDIMEVQVPEDAVGGQRVPC